MQWRGRGLRRISGQSRVYVSGLPVTNDVNIWKQYEIERLTALTALKPHARATRANTEYMYMLNCANEPPAPVSTAISP